MTRLNLLPWRQRRRRQRLRRFLGALAAAAIGPACAVALAGHHIADDVERLRRVNHQLTAEIAALDARLAEVDQLRSAREEIERKVATLRDLWAERPTATRTLGDLAAAAVPGAHYTRLARKDRAVVVHGVAESHDRVSDLMRNLRRAERFDAPVLEAITGAGNDEPSQGRRLAAFELSFFESGHRTAE